MSHQTLTKVQLTKCVSTMLPGVTNYSAELTVRKVTVPALISCTRVVFRSVTLKYLATCTHRHRFACQDCYIIRTMW